MAWYDVTGSIADLIMAGVAVYAAANANQWFSQRSHTKGFDKAEQLLADIDDQYGNLKYYISDLHNALEYLDAINERMTYVDGKKSGDYEMLCITHKHDIEKIDRLSENFVMLERWSLVLKNKNIIEGLLKKLRDSSVSAYNSSSLAQSCIYNAEHMGMEEFQVTLKHFKTNYDEYVKELADAEQKYIKFKKMKFINLFHVK